MTLAHLYDLPIAVWQAQNALLTVCPDAIAQGELEGALQHEWDERMTAQTVGAIYALFELEGKHDTETGLEIINPKSIKRFAANFCERSTNAQLATLSNCAERAAHIMQRLIAELGKAAELELTDRQDHGQHVLSDADMAHFFPNN